jgi:hypothetical protein
MILRKPTINDPLVVLLACLVWTDPLAGQGLRDVDLSVLRGTDQGNWSLQPPDLSAAAEPSFSNLGRSEASPNWSTHPELSQSPAPSLGRHLLLGAGLGLAAGFLLGWTLDGNQDSVASAGSFWNYDSDYYYRINGSIIGALIGGGVGGLVFLLRD